MADVAVQDPQTGDDPVQDTANPQSAADDPNVDPQKGAGDDSQTDQAGANELPKFHYQFSKDYQGHEKLKDFQKPDDLAQAYIELVEKANAVETESGESGEDVSVQDASEYDFTGIEDPTGQIGGEDVQEVKDLAYKLKLSKDQARGLYESVVSDLNSMIEKQDQSKQQQAEANDTALRKEFGDQFKEKATEAHRAYEQLGSKEFGDLLDSYGLGNHPDVVKTFLNIHEKISEDSLVEGGPGGGERNIAKEWFPNSLQD